MGAIFGGKSTISHEENRINALQVQQSTYGTVIPVVFGTNRVAGNLIDYMDFTAIPHTKTTTSGGKGGGGVTSSETTYTYEVAVIFSVCEGRIAGVGKVWRDKEIYQSPEGLRFVVFNGDNNQKPWNYTLSKHPERALCYPGTAYLATPNLDLRNSGSLPNLNFEIKGSYLYKDTKDSHPADIIKAIIADEQIGVGFPEEYIADLSNFRNYCTLNNILFSPSYTAQSEAQEIITSLCQAANTEPVWSQGKLKFVPYGLVEIKKDDVIYTPPKAPIYDLSMDDYVYIEGEPPVRAKPNLVADRFNVQPIEIMNRANDYNVEPIKATDDVDISNRGIRQADSIEMHFITEAEVGQFAAQSILQRQLYTAMQYEFTLSWRHCLLEPMDVITITENDFLGIDHQPVRIITIEEDDEQNLLVVAEDCPEGVNSPTLYKTQAANRPSINAAANPGNTNAPIIFNAPTGLTVCLAVSGNSENWGGCGVWVSLDGNSFERVGSVTAPAISGYLTTDLAMPTKINTGANGETILQNPDLVNVLKLNLSESKGKVYNVSQEAADSQTTLSYVDGEYIAYRDAVLTGENSYDLSYLIRGIHGTTISSHLAGVRFVKYDNAIFKYNYDEVNVNKKIYVKLTSFNVFGKAEQSLDIVPAYEYVLRR